MERCKRKTRTGVVVGGKMDKTIVVRVQRMTRHPLYGKTLRKFKKYYAHDEKNEATEGDLVKIMETRPLSKLKRWRLVEVFAKAAE